MEVLSPVVSRALTKDEAYRLVFTAASVMRQGVSIDGVIPRILDELFGPSEIKGFTQDHYDKVKARLHALGYKSE